MKTSIPLCVVVMAALAGSRRRRARVRSRPFRSTATRAFAACRCATQVNGVCFIGPWSISGAPGDGVLIENVTAPFRLVNMTVTNSKGAGVRLKNVDGGGATVVSGTQTSLQFDNIGPSSSTRKTSPQTAVARTGLDGGSSRAEKRDDQQELPRRHRRDMVLGHRHSRLGPQRQRAGRSARLGRLRPRDPALERRRRPLRERHRLEDRPQFGEQ